ncbi:MAG: peptidylprolyl isomerase [Parasphingopyxis sp.]|uniref:peptidylprolyl isomerase n=1 Tax=Parasphingopyxis sp. TaxID=1920299 RepID=UPI0032EB374E
MRLKLWGFLFAVLLAGCSSSDTAPEALADAANEGPVVAGATAATPEADPENTLLLDLSTGGRVAIRLRPDVAPNHVERIKTLARQGFYNGIIFHRVIDGFMAQTGDPTGTGEGGSNLPDLSAEFSRLPHVRGAVSMARANEPDSANSQFFITFMPSLRLDENYTVFGRVISGMQFVDAIPRGEPPARPARIIRASVAADNVPPPTAAEINAVTTGAADPASAIDAALAEQGMPEDEGE